MIRNWLQISYDVFLTLHKMDVKGSKKTLIMREINEESVSSLLGRRDALADCDVAAFVYDSSDATSWKCAVDLLLDVAAHGERCGFEVPCLVVAAKDDLEPDPTCIKSSIRVWITLFNSHLSSPSSSFP
jgi:Ras family protein T1